MTALRTLPSYFRKLVVSKLTPVFKDAVSIVSEPLMMPEAKHVLVRNRFVGINASDINMTAGRYIRNAKLPFDLGFEGVGEVVSVGNKVADIKIGQAVMYLGMNAFSEYVHIPENKAIPIPMATPEFIPLLASGTTASLSLDKAGYIVPGETVLITAAAGGAGHLAVQWAKTAGCHIIGLCSSAEKIKYLKGIGCDRPINYKEESLEEILKNEYPRGLDVVWETVGGRLFDLLFANLAVKGRMIVVGAIANYREEKLTSGSETVDIPLKLLRRSTSLTGFFLNHYEADIPHYLNLLIRMTHEQKLKVLLDLGNTTSEGPFQGLSDIGRAVDYLHDGRNKGKVVVEV